MPHKMALIIPSCMLRGMGYIVLIFRFVRMFICWFVCSFVCRGITSKFYVKVSQNGYILATTYHKAFHVVWVMSTLDGQL